MNTRKWSIHGRLFKVYNIKVYNIDYENHYENFLSSQDHN